MNNITYLLGAGASANAIPMVSEINTHLRLMVDYIKEYNSSDRAKIYIADIEELLVELVEFNTIDNYARVLSQGKNPSNRIQLKKLKSILCGLFLFEQLKKRNAIVNKFDDIKFIDTEKAQRTIDRRYKGFFGKTLDGEKLSSEINIITWNYDIQLEIGLESNLNINYAEVYNASLIFPHPSYKNEERAFTSSFFGNSPKIVKMNGTAGIFIDKNGFSNIYLNQSEFFDDRISILLDIHKEIERYVSYNPFLKFAWEKDDLNKKAIEFARNIIQLSQILVVIGYSFPDFNRAIDQQVFAQKDFSEIYVQMPEDNFETVKYNMKTSLGRYAEKAILIKNLNDFFIPSEFVPPY